MRELYVGNLEDDIRQSDLERLFSKYGRVERVDMKTGFAFVCFENERDAEDAIRGTNNTTFGYKQQRELSVQWAKGGERGKLHDRKAASNQRPTKTLFVINFDHFSTRIRDIEKHFEQYGKIRKVRIRRNYAFVQFASQKDATKAFNSTQNSKILDNVISVEYALPSKNDNERENRHVSSPRRRSASPVYRMERPSPEYDTYKSPASYVRQRSPSYFRYRSRSPIQRAREKRHVSRRRRSPSPVYRMERPSPEYDTYKGPASYERQRSASYFRYRSRSPIQKAREKRHVSSRRRKSPSPGYRMGRPSPEYEPNKGPAPYERQRSPSHFRYRRRSPIQRATRS